MNSLLNALKKAEEEKRRRAALAAQPVDIGDGTASAQSKEDEIVPEVLPAEAWVFEPLPETQTELVLATDESSLELVPESEANTDLSFSLTALDEPELAQFSNAVETDADLSLSLSAPDEPNRSETTTEAEPDAEQPAQILVASEQVQSVAESLAATEPSPVAAVAPLPPTAAVQASPSTSPILDHKRQSERSLWPWLVLGGGVLLLGLVVWFTWEYQQLSQSTSSPLPSAHSLPASASTPVQVAEQSVVDSALKNTPTPNAAGYIAEGDKIKEAQPNTVQGIESAVANPAPAPRVNAPQAMAVDEVRFIRTPVDNLSPLQQAWEAYQQGEMAKAELLYRKILNTEPRQRDALLGLAAIHVQRGQLGQAAGIYDYLLGLNPQDQAAQQAKLALNPEQINAEQVARLQQSPEAETASATSPVLLGQYYASRSRWQEAQAQFFQAWSAQPDSPDLAFNLAVSLDHLQQQKLALEFYQKALDLAQRKQATFDRAAADSRLAQLRLAGF